MIDPLIDITMLFIYWMGHFMVLFCQFKTCTVAETHGS